MTPTPRPSILGPSTGPPPPYPLYLSGPVTRGFGRGSKDLGCPTANLPDSALAPYSAPDDKRLRTGVHYGLALVRDVAPPTEEEGSDVSFDNTEHGTVQYMVMSVGYNPFYGGLERRTAEVHILHPYPCDFYGKELRVIVLGWIREELDYAGRDALIADIQRDILIAKNSLARPAYERYKGDEFFGGAGARTSGDRARTSSDQGATSEQGEGEGARTSGEGEGEREREREEGEREEKL